MALLDLKFGTFDFNELVEELDFNLDSQVNEQKVTKRHGVTVADPTTLEPRIVRVRGSLIEANLTALRDKLSTLNKALNSGKQDLTIYDDRFMKAVKRRAGFSYVPGSKMTMATFAIEFLGFDPTWQSNTETTESFSTATSKTFSYGGDFFVMPTLEISVAPAAVIAAGTEIEIKNTSLPGTLLMTFVSPAGGISIAQQPLKFDMGLFKVEDSAGINLNDNLKKEANFSFLRLDPGTNAWTFTSANPGGLTFSGNFKFRNRFL